MQSIMGYTIAFKITWKSTEKYYNVLYEVTFF